MQVPACRAALRAAVGVTVACCLGSATLACAADLYPALSITLINLHVAGSLADTLARALTADLQKRLKQPVVADGATTIGTGFVARAKPDR